MCSQNTSSQVPERENREYVREVTFKKILAENFPEFK